jgi:8-amino-7-oxononanoate synthase
VPEHEALECEAAAHFSIGSTLYFGGGCIVNFANFSTLPQCGGLVVHDELVHARVHEGLRRRRAELAEVSQNDVVAFDAAIGNWNEIRSCCDP